MVFHSASMILEELIQGVGAASRIDWQKFETFYAYFHSVTCQTSVWLTKLMQFYTQKSKP